MARLLSVGVLSEGNQPTYEDAVVSAMPETYGLSLESSADPVSAGGIQEPASGEEFDRSTSESGADDDGVLF